MDVPRPRERSKGSAPGQLREQALSWERVIWIINDLLDNPEAALVYLAALALAFVTGIAFHEFSHAWAANELGDDTAARQGRLTLNPIAHLDPMGTLLLFVAGFGWGRPTPVNPYRLRSGVKRGNMTVAVAGPLSNFAFALLAALPLILGWVEPPLALASFGRASGGELLGAFLFLIAWINVVLGVFNLIPIHPLDGFKVLVGVLPDGAARAMIPLSRWGPALLIALVALNFIAPQYSPLNWIFGRAADAFLGLVA